jgi:hypothetical protein
MAVPSRNCACVHTEATVVISLIVTLDIQPALTNVRFWRQSGHDSNGSLCRLMTQNGHRRRKLLGGCY